MEIKYKKVEVDADTNRFIEAIKNSTELLSCNYKSLDYLFELGLKLQEKQNNDCFEHCIDKPVEFLLKEILKNENVSPELTLYAIDKFISNFSKTHCQDVIDSLVAEYSLRQHLCKLTENSCDVDLDWFKINNFVDDVTKTKQNEKFLNALQFETTVVLNAVKHNPSPIRTDILLEEIINCLESQEDLKLWYTLMKPEHLDVILSLCVKHHKLLQALFRCFDRFAEEIESNYDEDLNVKYSHVNLDFEDFVQVFQSFARSEELAEAMNEFLIRRMDIENKNFNFWLDVKACL